jgi:hypothetical protein
MRAVACVAATIGTLAGAASARAAGPDIIVGELLDVIRYNVTGEPLSYVIGTLSCNIGDQYANWIPSSNQHPVIAQSLYRVRDGRIEQIGIAWVKHSFAATIGSYCGFCENPGTSQRLGAGCSDPYFASTNAQHFSLGPRSEVNAFTGVFSFPFTIGWQQSGDTAYKRIQVSSADINPALNTGALYFAEGQYVLPDEAPFGNQFNNASYKRMTVGGAQGGSWNLSFTGDVRQMTPAIFAWRERTNGPDADDDLTVAISAVDVPGEGRFYLGHKVTDLGGGQWAYEYAVQNLNSHRSAGSFSVPVGAEVNVSSIGFHDVNYHSGEPYSGTDWPGMVSGGTLTWATETIAANPNANALRWGTLYNFRFIADRPPVAGNVSLGLFRTGSPASLSIAALVPESAPPPVCPGDVNGDQQVTGADLSVLLAQFGQNVPLGTGADINSDGTVNGADLSVLLSAFGQTCK